ncbi:MAG TPA: SRPBCC family protein [Dehalococcoidia bacterium]|nr:SRPBCC family protein [Dehalococcoidia bacterium]
MPLINKSIEIEAPREQVFAEAADPTKQPDWALFLKDIAVTSGDGRSPGSRQAWLFKVGPRPAETMEAVVTQFHENESVSRQTSSGLPLSESMNFIAVDDGTTRVHWSIEYKPPLGPLGKMLDGIFINRVFQNDIETSLERLKRRLEA